MSFGFSAANDDLKTTISTAFPLMKFAGKCSAVSSTYNIATPIANASGSASTLYQVLWYMNYQRGIDCKIGRVVIRTPVIPGSTPPLVFFYIPSGVGTVIPLNIISNGNGTWDITLATVSLVTSIEGYCFYSAPGVDSGDGFGFQLFDENSGIIFDAGWQTNAFLKIQDIKNVTATAGQSFSSGAVVKPAVAFKFNHSRVFAGSEDIIVPGVIIGIQGETIWTKFVLGGLGLARSSATFTVTEAPGELTPLKNTHYGSYEQYSRADGQTHYLPIINAADYD